MGDVRRSLLTIDQPPVRLSVHVLTSGRVRLRLEHGAHTHDWQEDTLEDLMLLAATLPELNADLYDALMWELDLHGRR